MLLLALNYLGIVTASLGMLFFIPQIIKSLGTMSNMTVGWLTMIPYICGGIALVVWGRISDRMHERRWNLLAACVLSTGGLVLAGLTMGTWWAMVGMSLAAMGFYGSKGPFFAMPPMFLSGTALAAGFAWINSIGNLGGFFGPWWIGLMKDATGSYSGGLYGLALLSLVSAVGCALFLNIPDPSKTASQPSRRSSDVEPSVCAAAAFNDLTSSAHRDQNRKVFARALARMTRKGKYRARNAVSPVNVDWPFAESGPRGVFARLQS